MDQCNDRYRKEVFRICTGIPEVLSVKSCRILVDLVRFELTTSSMPWKRAPNCATGPLVNSFHYTTSGPIDTSRAHLPTIVRCLAGARAR
jgi:hypothetical protein